MLGFNPFLTHDHINYLGKSIVELLEVLQVLRTRHITTYLHPISYVCRQVKSRKSRADVTCLGRLYVCTMWLVMLIPVGSWSIVEHLVEQVVEDQNSTLPLCISLNRYICTYGT